MGKATVLTPVFFFSSVRAGSGKSSVVANLAIYANSLRQKVAIIDISRANPQKLKATFPVSVKLQEYGDILQMSSALDSRYQKTFYFTETDNISLFPAHGLCNPNILFEDTGLRDFLIQLKSSFDLILVNYPCGLEYVEELTTTLNRTYLWRGMKPAAAIVSTSDERSIVAIDSALQRNIELSHLLSSKILLLFNKVPASPEEQNLSDTTLNSVELKSVVNYPNIFINTFNDEFFSQRGLPHPLVLDQSSFLHQFIASLNRTLNRMGSNTEIEAIDNYNSNFSAVIDGNFLEKLSPFIRKIKKKVASRLFLHPSQIQVFLEENEQDFRIRIRTAGFYQPLLPVTTAITVNPVGKTVMRDLPVFFDIPDGAISSSRNEIREKNNTPTISVRPIFAFDDRFAWNTSFSLNPISDFYINRDPQPSPIIFKAQLTLADVPSLADVLGFGNKKFRNLAYNFNSTAFEVSSVTHFFIPPEFDIKNYFGCKRYASYSGDLNLSQKPIVSHHENPASADLFLEDNSAHNFSLPDLFARSMPFQPEHGFELKSPPASEADFPYKDFFHHSFTSTCQYFLPVAQEFSSSQPALELLSTLATKEMEIVSSNIHYMNRLSFTFINSPIYDSLANFSFTEHVFRNEFVSKIEDPPAIGNFENTLPAESFTGLSHQLETKPCYISETIHFHTNPAFCHLTISHEIQKDDFAHVKFDDLPEQFHSDVMLLDHCFINWWAKDPIQQKFHFSNKHKQNTIFSFPTIFPQDYHSRKPEQQPVRIGFPEKNVRQIFNVSLSGFDKLTFYLPVNHKSTRWDILRNSHTLSKDKNYRSTGNINDYSSNKILDDFIRQRKISLSKKNMLKLKAVNQVIPSIYVQQVSQKQFSCNFTNPVYLPPDLDASQLQFSNFLCEIGYFIINPQIAIQKMASLSTKIFKKDNFGVVFDQVLFSYPDEIELFTIPARMSNSSFHIFAPSNLLDLMEFQTNINAQTSPFQEPGVIKTNFPFAYCDFSLPRDVPMRHKSVEKPDFSTFMLRQFVNMPHPEVLKIYDCKATHSLCFCKARLPAFKARATSLPLSPDKFHMIHARQSFYQFSSLRTPFNLKRIDPLTELYENLLYNLRAQKCVSFKFTIPQGKTDSNALTNAGMLGEYVISRFKLTEKQSLTIKRLPLAYKRNFVILTRTRFKDLRNLARQTIQKFNKYENNV